MKKLLLTGLVSSTALLLGCSEPEILSEDKTPRVKVVNLDETFSQESLYFPAVATAAERSHLSFRVAGEISKLNVKEGDQVKKGDVVAEIDPTDYKLDVDNAAARYSVVDSQFRRSRPLVEKGLLAKSQFDEIAAQRQIALAELELAKLRLSFTKLRAPVDGIISRVNVDKFENIQVGTYIVNIHSIESVEVTIQLPDRLYAGKSSDTATAIVRVPSGNTYSAEVKEFTTEPDPASGTFTVTLSMPMPESEYILDGMAVEVTADGESVGLELNKGVRVPIEAVFNEDGDELERDSKYVWVLDGNVVKKQRVKVGKASQSSLQILEGLDRSQQVVVAGLSRLREGMNVEVISVETIND